MDPIDYFPGTPWGTFPYCVNCFKSEFSKGCALPETGLEPHRLCWEQKDAVPKLQSLEGCAWETGFAWDWSEAETVEQATFCWEISLLWKVWKTNMPRGSLCICSPPAEQWPTGVTAVCYGTLHAIHFYFNFPPFLPTFLPPHYSMW